MYVFIINFIASNPSSLSQEENSREREGSSQKIEIGNSVSVSVVRTRVYGKIIESGGDSQLLFMGFLPIPLKSNGMDYIKIHLGFLVIIFYIVLKGGKKNVKAISQDFTDFS